MKNNTNIYDIDGQIIRESGDNHRFTIEEALQKVQYYQQKIKELSEKENPTDDDKNKIKIYENYCKNLMDYEWASMMRMDKNTLASYLAPKTTEEEVNKALNELKDDISTGIRTDDEVREQTTGNKEDSTVRELRDNEVMERGESDVQEERTVTQDDLMVERSSVNNNMDEYVDYIEE